MTRASGVDAQSHKSHTPGNVIAWQRPLDGEHYLFAIYSNYVEHILKMSAPEPHPLYEFCSVFFQVNWSDCEVFLLADPGRRPSMAGSGDLSAAAPSAVLITAAIGVSL